MTQQFATSIPSGLIDQGYKLLQRGHQSRFKNFGTWEKNGVRVALSSNCLAVERGVSWSMSVKKMK